MSDENFEEEFLSRPKKPFNVTISDEDYLADDDFQVENIVNEDKPKFEINFVDDEESVNDSENEYKGEIYFSNQKPGKVKNVSQNGRKRKKNKKNGSGGALAVFLVVMIAVAVSLSIWVIVCIDDIVAFGRSDETVTVTIPLEADTNEIIDILYENDLIKQKHFCKLFYNLMDTIKNLNKTNKKQPVYLSGVYYVEKNMGLEGYLYEFREVQRGNDSVRVIIPEGWCVYQIFDRLEKFGVCSKSRLIGSITGTSFEYNFLSKISDSNYRTFKIEGYLYPNTYDFFVDSDPNSVIRKLLDESELKWTDEYEAQAKKLGYTRDQIMIIASIIQREAANKEQMGLVSSVIHNRLKHSVSWPTLGCDSTLNYITSYVKENVTSTQELLFEQRYNTYTVKGLPPGPICNPGDDAIYAALFPDETNYYFFRHDKYGKIYMASTQSEHDANANLVLRANNK